MDASGIGRAVDSTSRQQIGPSAKQTGAVRKLSSQTKSDSKSAEFLLGGGWRRLENNGAEAEISQGHYDDKWEKRGWCKTRVEEERFQRNGGRSSFLPTALRRVITSGLPTRLSRTKIHHVQNEVLYSHTHSQRLQTIKYVQKR